MSPNTPCPGPPTAQMGGRSQSPTAHARRLDAYDDDVLFKSGRFTGKVVSNDQFRHSLPYRASLSPCCQLTFMEACNGAVPLPYVCACKLLPTTCCYAVHQVRL